ncbi:hypothetical protein PR048_028312 [Dryococelus australis]|uniref:Ionotropic glutamate receptor C-terminal domain-containing protein n=1 Tax=Dryococelus australis TaxID=614101 RepID=A0ABQ9GIX4_9NEOP|nr:hypothetical protein PR048_028312 [Dryococelus australis]
MDKFLKNHNRASFLIVVKDIRIVTRLIEVMSSSYYFNYRTKIIVVHYLHEEEQVQNTTETYISMLKKTWDVAGMLNVAVYTCDMGSSKAGDSVIIFNPFLESGQGHAVKLSSDSIGLLLGRKTMDLHGHPVRITLFPLKLLMVPVEENGTVQGYTGRDGCMLAALSRKMNFTPVVLSPTDGATYGYLMDDGTYRGTLGHLVNRQADLSINSRYIRDYGSQDVEFTAPAIAQERLCVLTPRALPVPTWVTMVRCYSWQMWVLIVLTFAACSLLWAAVRAVDCQHPSLPLHEHIIVIVNIFLSNTLVSFTKYTTHSQRAFLTACMLFSIVIINIFVGNIYNALTIQRYFSDIKSLQELDNSGMKVAVFYRSMIDTFDDVHNPVLRNLNSKFFFTKSKLLLFYVSEKRNLSIVNTETYLRFVVKDTRHGEEKLNIVDECPRTYGVSYIVPRRSPYKDEFYRIISRLSESGHVTKWTEDYIHKTTTAKRIRESLEGVHEERTKVFNLADLQVAFYMLILGLPLSAIVFIFEVGRSKYRI